MGAFPCCICCPNPFHNVQQGNIGLVTRFGRFHETVDPGLVKVNPLSECLIQVDLKLQILGTSQSQQGCCVCMTNDDVSLQLTSAISYRVVSPNKAASGIANVRQALMEHTQATLCDVVRARVLQGIIGRREEVAQSVCETIEAVANGLGVQVESVLIKGYHIQAGDPEVAARASPEQAWLRVPAYCRRKGVRTIHTDSSVHRGTPPETYKTLFARS